MTLAEIHKTINYSNTSPILRKILKGIELFHFHRDGTSKFQTFYFHFYYKNKKYILEHSFHYHGTGVDNWYKFRKPTLLSPKPFLLTQEELFELSTELMKAVNEWNR